jgi:phosphoribosylformylglycinamidine synthase
MRLMLECFTDKKAVLSVIMDKMTESELCSIDEAHSIFNDFEPRPFVHVDILSKGKSALEHANTTLGIGGIAF